MARSPAMSQLLRLVILLSLVGGGLRAAETASLVTEGWQHRVWSIYPIEKVKADEELPPTPKAEAVELSAARGEREPFLLLLRPNIPLRDVTVVTGDLR